MGIFKSIKALTRLSRQAKQMQEKQLEDAGYEPGMRGSLGQLGDLLDQANVQLGVLSQMEGDRARILAEGVDAEGTIIGMGTPARAATMFNLMIDLEVRAPGWDPYRVAQQYLVPSSAVLGQGVTLPIKVDPNDKAKIAIDWDRAATKPIAGQIRPVESDG